MFDLSDVIAVAILIFAMSVSVVLSDRSWRRAAMAIWTLAIVAVTVPFFDLHAHTHWLIVEWNPFRSWTIKPSDIAANVLLYVPFGWFSRADRPLARRVSGTAGAAAVVSFLTEASQLFSHSRIPSTSDFACNVLGAVAGVIVSVRVERARPGSRP